jgi:hypothetical protein
MVKRTNIARNVRFIDICFWKIQINWSIIFLRNIVNIDKDSKGLTGIDWQNSATVSSDSFINTSWADKHHMPIKKLRLSFISSEISELIIYYHVKMATLPGAFSIPSKTNIWSDRLPEMRVPRSAGITMLGRLCRHELLLIIMYCIVVI